MEKNSKYRYFYHFVILFIVFLNHHSLYAANITFWDKTKSLGVEVKLPYWALEKDVSSTEENGIKEDGNLYNNVKIYKPSSKPKNWSHFFSIQIESGMEDPVAVFKDLQVGAYINYCKSNSLAFNLIKESSDQIVFSVFCGKYKHDISKGEVAVYSMIKHKSFFVKIFHQWRGGQMDINDSSSWNTSKEEMTNIIKDISSIKIHFKK